MHEPHSKFKFNSQDTKIFIYNILLKLIFLFTNKVSINLVFFLKIQLIFYFPYLNPFVPNEVSLFK
jgi:hypothetical protein